MGIGTSERRPLRRDREAAAMSRLAPTEGDIQKLADITFQIGIVASQYMHGKTTEEVATWIAHQLRECGFPNEPVGSCWGYLTGLPSMRTR